VSGDARTNELLDEIAKLIAPGLRERAEDINAMILALDKMGFDGPRIAELMGTTPSAVRGVKHRAANKPTKQGTA